MAESPIIETERLIIEPFSEKHLSERYVSWLNDPEVIKYSEQRHITHTIESCREYMNSYANTPNYFWAITERKLNLGHIGNMNAYVDNGSKIADLGILIGEKLAWKQGYATEAWSAVCSYLLNIAGMKKITAGALEINIDMINLMKRTGMVEEYRTVYQFPYNGETIDIVHGVLQKNLEG